MAEPEKVLSREELVQWAGRETVKLDDDVDEFTEVFTSLLARMCFAGAIVYIRDAESVEDAMRILKSKSEAALPEAVYQVAGATAAALQQHNNGQPPLRERVEALTVWAVPAGYAGGPAQSTEVVPMVSMAEVMEALRADVAEQPTIKPCDEFLDPGRCRLTKGHEGAHVRQQETDR